MNGVICVYKPQGFTSFDVVAVVRRICGTKKVGHGGTLDPMAEGVLPVFVGNATKAADFCPGEDKEYLAGFRFGLTTDTQDITGDIIEEKDVYVSRNKMALIERCCGEIEQLPPMFSAVQVDGVRLYDLARRGIEVERKPRRVTIHSVKIEEYRDNNGLMRVHCSKGTYIRTLIHDFGQQLGAGAVMTSLVRTRSGNFTLAQCHTVDFLKDAALTKGPAYIESLLMPLEKLFEVYPAARLDAVQSRLLQNGAELDADRVRLDRVYSGLYAVLDCNGHIVALGRISDDHSLEVVQRFQPPEIKLAKGVKKLPKQS